MTKQEEILKRIADSVRLGICAYQHMGFDNLEMYNLIADKIAHQLDFCGVVIKVDRELPPQVSGEMAGIAVSHIHLFEDYGLSLVAVEPLIKKEK
ncbi:hypothetical protein LCGC14_1519390 [marine sediment metagenome]|uniref:Uncharacterized protein n=1 Tax=marine sediment metagenome TaxID=412755 RepID=A0A0F9JJX7_9ZZZZ